MTHSHHRVVVGNIGTVYDGYCASQARADYLDYVHQSTSGYGRAANEEVTWFVDGEIFRSHSVVVADEDYHHQLEEAEA